ncbi:MAG: DRTGG domain-containing protein [Bacteroidota bacterium]
MKEKMNLKKLTDDLEFTILSGKNLAEAREPKGAFTSDLLSDVMGKAEENMLWITSQTHKNILAIASLKELSGIIIVNNNREVKDDVLELAKKEDVVIIKSNHPAFETSGMLFDYLNQ